MTASHDPTARIVRPTISRMVAIERMTFVTGSRFGAAGELLESTYEHLEPGTKLDVLEPNEDDRRDMAIRAKEKRPELVVVRWNGKPRLVPRLCVVREKHAKEPW